MFSSPYGYWEKDLNSFIGQQFKIVNKGEFKIIGMKPEKNEFKCEPVSGRRKIVQYFDFGNVLRTIKEGLEKRREA